MYKNMVRIKGDLFPCGHLNIPYGNEFIVGPGNVICYKDKKEDRLKPVCLEASEFAFTNFAYNEDGKADERYQIIKDAIDIMADIVDKDRYFAEFFHDDIAKKYKKTPNPNEWIWNRLAVHKAPIEDLYHILDLLRDMLRRCKIDYPYAYDKHGRPLPLSAWK